MNFHARWITLLSFALLAMPLQAEPLVIGDTFTLESEVLDETRRINVYVPTMWGEAFEQALPVLYMPDGGINEDFLHVAGLLQVSVSNGTMRPFILVGIENTQRRRDLTGPTSVAEDKAIAPVVGGSAKFRDFLRTELFPEIEQRHDITSERAIIGESLAGLFIVETLLREPELFDTYIAIDPSLWWNEQALTKIANEKLQDIRGKSLFIASGEEAGNAGEIAAFIAELRKLDNRNLDWHYADMTGETHATIYHPAALRAVRLLLAPTAE